VKQIFIFVIMTLVVAFGSSCSTDNHSRNASHSKEFMPPSPTTKQGYSISANPLDINNSVALKNSVDIPTSGCFSTDMKYTQSKVDPASLTGYRIVETKCFTFYAPEDWVIKIGEKGPVEISKNGKLIGEMEVYSYFDADTWISKGFKPNHSEQLEFKEIISSKIEGMTLYAYRSKLKVDPPKNSKETYKYETAALVTIKEIDRSFVLFVDSQFMSDKMAQTIISTVRLK
jgi:hypothetical protein